MYIVWNILYEDNFWVEGPFYISVKLRPNVINYIPNDIIALSSVPWKLRFNILSPLAKTSIFVALKENLSLLYIIYLLSLRHKYDEFIIQRILSRELRMFRVRNKETLRIVVPPGNGLPPVQHHAITWNNADSLPTGPPGTNFSVIWKTL